MIVMRRLSAAVEFGYPRENCRASSAGLMREPYKARSPRKSFDGVAIADPGPGSKSPAYADYSHWVTLNERTGKKLVLCNIAHAYRFLSFRDFVLRPHFGTEIDSPSSTASPRHHSGRSLAPRSCRRSIRAGCRPRSSSALTSNSRPGERPTRRCTPSSGRCALGTCRGLSVFAHHVKAPLERARLRKRLPNGP
jgi:hypothetical protein